VSECECNVSSACDESVPTSVFEFERATSSSSLKIEREIQLFVDENKNKVTLLRCMLLRCFCNTGCTQDNTRYNYNISTLLLLPVTNRSAISYPAEGYRVNPFHRTSTPSNRNLSTGVYV